MMLVRCRVMPSKIHGLGVFAAERISKGESVWRYDSDVDYRIGCSDPRLAEGSLWKKHADTYGYIPHDTYYVEFPGDHAMFINHSYAPNIACPNGNDMEALRDIEVGEEILTDYREFDDHPESGGKLF